MKSICISIVLLSSILAFSINSYGQDELPVLDGPYLGQRPPGLTPEIFAQGVVSTEHHEWGLVFSPDMKEFYFSRRNNKSGKDTHFVHKYEGNRWHESEAESGVRGSFSPDESYILWDSKRDDGYGGSDIYVSFRQENGSWGKAINLGDKVNTSTNQRGGYVTPDGKYLFFMSPASTGKGDIFWVDAKIIETLDPK